MKKIEIKSSTLVYILTLYFSTILNLSFWRFIFTHLEITNFKIALFAVSLIIFISAPLFIFFNIMTVKKIEKYLIILLLIVCSITNFMMFKYGIYFDKNMMQNIFETNTREAFDLITPSLLIWMSITGLFPSILLLFTRIRYESFRKELKSRLSKIIICILITVIIGASTFKEYATFGRNNRQIKSLINIVNFTAGTIGYIKKIRLSQKQFTELDKNAKHQDFEKDKKIATVIIFIVGETARASNFSLDGYARETNPLLKNQDIAYFKDVSSCGTATAVSVPCMFSNMNRSDFDATEAEFSENLIDIAQKTGWHIIWRENDDGCKGVCARIKDVKTMKDINNPKYCHDNYCWDGVLTDDLDDILKNISQDTLIVLHMQGSHGPTYYQRYPESFKKFEPTCETADIQNCNLNQIVNTYDNTIVYTDYIVSSVIDIVKNHPDLEAGVIYASDHGESLGEGNIYLHGMPYKIAPSEQTNIPMLIWMNENMKKYDYIDYNCLKKSAEKNTFSHDNLFHSLLGLLEIKTSLYNSGLDILKECRTKPLPYMP